MAFSVNPITHVISVPRADLTLVSGTLYTHDTDAFRLELKAWEATMVGVAHLKTHNRNAPATIAGVIYAQGINMLAPYSVEYEPGIYSVVLIGSNNNIWDVASGILVQNSVQVIPTNAAGLIIAETGTSGLTPTESDALLQNTADLSALKISMTAVEGDIGIIQTDITSLQGDVASINSDIGIITVDITAIKDDIITINTAIGDVALDISQIQLDLAFIKAIESGEWKIENNQMIFFDTSDQEIARFNLFNVIGIPTNDDVYNRKPV